MKTRQLGRNGPRVSEIGLGCMGMSDLYGPADDLRSVTTIRAALEAGITLLDTGDYYGAGHNEMLIADALQPGSRDNAVLSVKFGALRDPAGGWLGMDARPAATKNFLAATLRRLRTTWVDIYRPGRLDPGVPVEDTVGAISEMVTAGYVKFIGLSEVGAETIRRAHAVHPITDVQIEYSLFSRGLEREVLPTCRELGIGVTAYGVLSRGLLSGHWSKDRAPRDFRGILPRFQGENLERNLALVEAVREYAKAKNATVAQVAIAWVLSRGTDVVPLVGARSVEHLQEVLGGAQLALTPHDFMEVETLVPAEAVAGDRYNEQGMRSLDSERAGS